QRAPPRVRHEALLRDVEEVDDALPVAAELRRAEQQPVLQAVDPPLTTDELQDESLRDRKTVLSATITVQHWGVHASAVQGADCRPRHHDAVVSLVDDADARVTDDGDRAGIPMRLGLGRQELKRTLPGELPRTVGVQEAADDRAR